MTLSKQHLKDVASIMGLPPQLAKDLIGLLPKIGVLDKPLSPLVKKIYGTAFELLGLKKKMKVLDLACGQGSVSIPLGIRYQVFVDGYDTLSGFISYARQKAKEKGVNHLCKFEVGDVRDVVKKAKDYDIVLWFSPPHLWKTAKETIKHLRACAKNGGYIVVEDAYLYPKAPHKKEYKTYETMKKVTAGFASFGDSILKIFDYKGADWKEDYEGDRIKIKQAIRKTENSRDKQLLGKYLEHLNKLEKQDTKNLGGAIWVIKVNKLI